MDVLEVFEEKRVLEEKIIDIVREFELKTNTKVEGVEINRAFYGGVNNPVIVEHDVKVKVCL